MAQLPLPEDLERLMFETAAVLYPRATLKLVLLCRRTHIWLQPLVYEVVSTFVQPKDPGLESIIRNGHHVKHLLLGRYASAMDIYRCLMASPNLIGLAIWCSDPRKLSNKTRELIRGYPLKRLSIPLHALFGSMDDMRTQTQLTQNPEWSIKSFHLCASVTHLTIGGEVGGNWRWLRELANLTHLAITNSELPSCEVLEGLLSQCRAKLRICILLLGRENIADGKVGRKMRMQKGENHTEMYSTKYNQLDLRIVLCRVADWAEDWEAGARMGEDAWTFAEYQHQERRRRVEELCRVLGDDGI